MDLITDSTATDQTRWVITDKGRECGAWLGAINAATTEEALDYLIDQFVDRFGIDTAVFFGLIELDTDEDTAPDATLDH